MSKVKNLFPDLKQNFTKTSSGSEVCSYTSDLGTDSPILTLIHGYPQSSYDLGGDMYARPINTEYRLALPQTNDLLDDPTPHTTCLPFRTGGYGVSTPTQDHSKRGVGSALLEALQKVFNISEQNPRKVILGGHDRGARICHRLAVDKNQFPALNVVGAILLDIVPTKVQWEAFSDPIIASGYFHWPLLANVETSVAMIKAYGGGQWCRNANMRIAGTQAGQQRIAADGGLEIYAALFDREDVLRYSSEDYAAGARIDVEEQTQDQEAGRKIEIPTLVMFSKAKLGSRQDVQGIWKNWIKEGVPYEGIGVGDDHGHYLPEEATEIVTQAVIKFLNQHT